jgi:hypothetical protein
MMRCLAASLLIPVRSAISFTIPTAASVSVYPAQLSSREYLLRQPP